MTDRETRLRATLGADRRTLQLVVNESGWLGKQARYWVVRKVTTHRKRGYEESTERSTGTLVLAAHQKWTSPALADAYHYEGSVVSICWVLVVRVDDGLLFDSKVEVPIELPDWQRASALAGEEARQLFEPKDTQSLRARYQGLPPTDRRRLVALTALTAVLVLANLVTGWHDANVPEAGVLFYDQRWRSDGAVEPGIALIKAVAGSLLLALAVMAGLFAGLSRNIRLGLKIRALPGRNVRLSPAQLLRGVARAPLEGAEVRVVAANVEQGMIWPLSGPRTYIRQAGRAICLYRQHLPRIPANAPIEQFLSGEIDFSLLYAALYPPDRLGETGLEVQWRVQLLHPQFADRTANGQTAQLQRTDFLPR